MNPDQENINVVKYGTTTVGLVSKDGIILGADKRATVGSMVVDKRTEKIFQVTENMALTMAGSVSDVQLLTKLLKAEIRLKQLRAERTPNVHEAANLLAGMIYANIRKFSLIPGISHFILGGKDEKGYHLYDLFADGSITEVRDYISSGSGSVFALGVLETGFKKEMGLKEGVSLMVKSLNAALQRDIASGNGIDVVTITEEGVKKYLEKELDLTIKA